jgi:hypothetical protein
MPMDASSGAKTTDQIVCPACLVSLAANAEVCSACGTPTRDKPAPAPPAHSYPRATTARPLLDRPIVILGLLFGVMAVLGIPLLWQSRAFGRPLKIVLSVVVTLYTAALIYGVGLICVWSYNNVVEALRS